MKKVVVIALSIAAALGGGFLASDLARPRCKRSMTRFLDGMGFRLGIVLVNDPYRYSWSEPTTAYHARSLPESLFHVGAERLSDNFPATACSVIAELGVVVLTAPTGWNPQEVFSAFEERHSGLARLPSPDTSLQPFLVLQKGCGVEGLQVQLSLTADGQLHLRERRAGQPSLQLIQRRVINNATSTRLFALARESGLATQHSAEGNWNWLDGRVLTLVFYDGSSVGRIQFLNSRPPSEAFVPLTRELSALAVKGGVATPLGPAQTSDQWWWCGGASDRCSQ